MRSVGDPEHQSKRGSLTDSRDILNWDSQFYLQDTLDCQLKSSYDVANSAVSIQTQRGLHRHESKKMYIKSHHHSDEANDLMGRIVD